MQNPCKRKFITMLIRSTSFCLLKKNQPYGSETDFCFARIVCTSNFLLITSTNLLQISRFWDFWHLENFSHTFNTNIKTPSLEEFTNLIFCLSTISHVSLRSKTDIKKFSTAGGGVFSNKSSYLSKNRDNFRNLNCY